MPEIYVAWWSLGPIDKARRQGLVPPVSKLDFQGYR